MHLEYVKSDDAVGASHPQPVPCDCDFLFREMGCYSASTYVFLYCCFLMNFLFIEICLLKVSDFGNVCYIAFVILHVGFTPLPCHNFHDCLQLIWLG